MKKKEVNHYDVLIAGAGFAGSLTALILQKTGLKVCLLEKGKHPRFAIGESSTPVADLILRKLSAKYDLPWLYDFSRYGSWQRSHPAIVCGIKRGFSFFKHYPGEDFTTDENHKNELLVAASSSDMESDTNWLRSDFDAFLVMKVKESGIDYFDLTEITEAKRNAKWQFEIRRLEETETIYSSFFIDASGSGALAQKLFAVHSSAADFLTNSFAVFSHFNNVPHWTEILQGRKIPITDFPYNPDWSALHQILDEGWMWMLRFNNERSSVGFVLKDQKELYEHLSADELWKYIQEKYPGIKQILKDTELHSQPGKIIKSGRLQRKMKNAFGHGWLALPNTIGFVDPLFSSGIAHSLSGIEKLADIFQKFWNDEKSFYQKLQDYENAVFTEIKLTDCLIAGCYLTMPYFELFNAWSMLYFAATIAHEQRRIKNQQPGYFLNADDSGIRKMVFGSYEDLVKIISSKHPSDEEIKAFTETIKERIHPFNTAGLLNPSCKNMYRHTVAQL
ncbi:MAG: NAD(P)/FAD-dependent oxidoreductase [Ginsengibacter sp.]